MTRKQLMELARKRRERMAELLAEGWSLSKIGRQYNCSRQRIWQILRDGKN